MKRVLFVCIENSNRSQIAQAFAIIYGKGNIEALSAGSKPSGIVNQKAIMTMKEIGYDLTKHTSKSLNDIPNVKYDYVITMGCGDKCPFINAEHHVEWNIPDPKEMPMNEVNRIRDIIKDKVIELIDGIK